MSSSGQPSGGTGDPALSPIAGDIFRESEDDAASRARNPRRQPEAVRSDSACCSQLQDAARSAITQCPCTTIGVAFGVGVLVGLLAALR